MKSHVDPLGGHHYVTLVGLGTRGVHQLVLRAFVGPPEPGHIGRHLDGDPTNNALINLAWGTHSDNTKDSLGHGTHYNATKTRCPKGHPLDMIVPGRQRRCRTCYLEKTREAEKRRRARRAAGDMTDLRRVPATHCKRNHEFTPENTMIAQGYRRCRACQRLRAEKIKQSRAA
jgi:hypothetical protein